MNHVTSQIQPIDTRQGP